MPRHLDLIMAHNYLHEIDQSWILRFDFEPFAEAHGFTFNMKTEPERYIHQKDILDRNLFPERALIYVHGGRFQKYQNFDRVLEISPLRPDLTFMIETDSFSGRDDFSSPKAYTCYRALPRLNEAIITSPDRNSPIICCDKDEYSLMKIIKEGSPMANYILYLVGRNN